MQQMFGDKVVQYVNLLTKEIPDDLYYELIKRNRYACYIKLADLRDNMDVSRLSEITERDVIRINNYKRREQEIIAAIAGFH